MTAVNPQRMLDGIREAYAIPRTVECSQCGRRVRFCWVSSALEQWRRHRLVAGDDAVPSEWFCDDCFENLRIEERD